MQTSQLFLFQSYIWPIPELNILHYISRES